MTRILNRMLGAFGLRLSRARPPAASGAHSGLFPDHRVADLEGLAAAAATIPGMLSEEAGKLLFALCYTQPLEGDVVEIGSWQGYSTSFLARAVLESGNGRLYAVDHFRGNVGTEAYYVAGEPDLSDLPRRFADNMRRLGVDPAVRLLAMPNAEAAARLSGEGTRVRFLFIDGDHTREGVQRDVDLFFPLLVKGAIVVFDDCSTSAPGVVGVIDDLLRRKVLEKGFAYPNGFVARVP